LGNGRAWSAVVSRAVVAGRPLSPGNRRGGGVGCIPHRRMDDNHRHWSFWKYRTDCRLPHHAGSSVILAAAIGAYVLAALFAERRESEAHLARANAMLERERDNKLLNAEAVTAAIAHEMRQPLTAIVTNADAALLGLERTPPNHDKARATLTSIKSDGHRAIDVFRQADWLLPPANTGPA
jgi:signal transduction histidine kinase